jgi:hypothetical protein
MQLLKKHYVLNDAQGIKNAGQNPYIIIILLYFISADERKKQSSKQYAWIDHVSIKLIDEQ